jgi:hypothetical protein
MSRRSVIALVTAAVLGLVAVSVLAVLVADGDRRVGAISELEASPGYWALQVDGQIVGRLASVETCGPYGEVTQSLSSGSQGQTQYDTRIGRVKYPNCVVRFGLGMGLPLFNWINRTLDRQPLKKNVVLVGFDGDDQPQVGLRLMNALIKKVVFPEVEAETIAPYLITLTIQPETVVRDEPAQISGPGPTGTGVVGATIENLRLNNQNLADVNKFGPVVVTQETVEYLSTTPAGVSTISATPRRLTYEPVQVEAVRSPNHPLATWFDDFVVQGQRSNNAERDAKLQIRDDEFRNPIELSFEGVGIFDSSDSADLIWRRYSLYIQNLSMDFFPIVTTAPPPEPPPPPTQTQTQTTETETTETETTETEPTETETTETETEPPPDDPQPPAAPVEPRAFLNEKGGVELEWGPVDEAEGYVILMSREPGGDYAEIARSEGPTVVVERLEGGPPYYFVVRALRGETQSANSVEVAVKG